MVAGGEAFDFLIEGASDGDQPIETLPASRLENQRGFDDRDGGGVALKDRVHPLLLGGDDGRMDDGVEFGDAVGRKNGIGKARAVDGLVRIENSTSKF